jgi:ProP effector
MSENKEPSALASAGPLECASTPPARSLNSQDRTVDQTISALAELFPAVFVADRWKPHKPLKIGIHQDLIDAGVLSPDECRDVLRLYTWRLQYQKVVAAGGPRFDLDGHADGEVSPDEIAHAKAIVTAIEQKREAKARAIATEKKAARKAAKLPAPTQAPREVLPAPLVKPRRLGLADLKAAARARREAAGEPQADPRNSGGAP